VRLAFMGNGVLGRFKLVFQSVATQTSLKPSFYAI
jgi:hypothetical protein